MRHPGSHVERDLDVVDRGAAVRRIESSSRISCDPAWTRQGIIDTRLWELGRPRRASVTVPYHALAAAIVQESNLVATLPNRLLDALTIHTSLAVISTPPLIGPVSFSMAWHPRLDNDPAQQWLRETIRSATSSHHTSDPATKPG